MKTLIHPTVMTVCQQPTVMTVGYFYAVDLGSPVSPQHHRVGINGECTCPLGRQCPAVYAVREYLANGGQRAERPPFGYYPVRPAKCPVCHQDTATDVSLSSRNRGEGWVCPSGKSHYWQHRAHISAMRRELAERGKFV
jgi:hypothetical protein